MARYVDYRPAAQEVWNTLREGKTRRVASYLLKIILLQHGDEDTKVVGGNVVKLKLKKRSLGAGVYELELVEK